MSDSRKKDFSLEVLLSLDGEVFPMDNGYWTKFEVWLVPSTPHIPHGIRYSLTLHDRNNLRILGYDNAHAFKSRKKKYGAHRVVWDHVHELDMISPYEFSDAGQLMEDFWRDVIRILDNESKL